GRLLQARANSGPRREMNDLVKMAVADEALDGGRLRQITGNEAELAAGGLDFMQIPFFKGRVIKGVKIVERGHGMALTQQSFANVGADKAGAASHQKVHGRNASKRPSGLAMTWKAYGEPLPRPVFAPRPPLLVLPNPLLLPEPCPDR